MLDTDLCGNARAFQVTRLNLELPRPAKGCSLTLMDTASLMRAITCSRSLLLPGCPCRRLEETLWAEQLMSRLR